MPAVKIENHAGDLKKTETLSCTILNRAGVSFTRQEQIVREHFLEISVNGSFLARLSCTPSDLAELVLGRLLTERIIDGTEEVERIFICGRGDIAEVYLKKDIDLDIWKGTEPTCCTGNIQLLLRRNGRELKELKYSPVDETSVFELAEYLKEDMELHRSTGGAHNSYLRMPGGGVRGFEDISRHNALDKAAGYMIANDMEPSECILFTSGRIAADIAVKAIAAGVPVLISKAAPTEEAVRLAKRYGLRIVGKAWPDSCTFFC